MTQALEVAVDSMADSDHDRAMAAALISIAESLTCLGELIEAIDGVRLQLKRIADVQEE